jgi:hypothetical protein
MSPLTERLLEQKRQRRQALARLPFAEKVRIVEQLRDAARRMAAIGQAQGLRPSKKPAS